MIYVVVNVVLPIDVAVTPAMRDIHLNLTVLIATANEEIVAPTALFTLADTKVVLMCHNLIIQQSLGYCKP